MVGSKRVLYPFMRTFHTYTPLPPRRARDDPPKKNTHTQTTHPHHRLTTSHSADLLAWKVTSFPLCFLSYCSVSAAGGLAPPAVPSEACFSPSLLLLLLPSVAAAGGVCFWGWWWWGV